ncbi:heme/hemin ABC transporter substrate-binding protein [Tellurirhabdus rosea]|uniref:heme/hemin ABC transporter substrate-binding protein n=1 Tax=Tellurirhabdus rosea TaxID=2674997 RepID=UPI00224F681B|nr:ABC transporter substrate-binding protein [Tellurirhabdus rosea]
MSKSMRIRMVLLVAVFLNLVGKGAAQTKAQPERIVSLNGTVTEIICALGLQNGLVGVDVTSTYPETVAKVPRVGHTRNMGAEAILALKPTLVVGTQSSGGLDVKPEVVRQLQGAGIKTLFFAQSYSPAGTKKLITDVATAFGQAGKASALTRKIDADLAKVRKLSRQPKVLFIYARGAGNMMVAGAGTSVEKIIQLAGGSNAVTGFENFKPLTAEALVTANPDVILLFTSGLESMGGLTGLLKVPGIAQTNAGRNRHVVEMDGQLLTGFGPRLGVAALELNQKISPDLALNH